MNDEMKRMRLRGNGMENPEDGQGIDRLSMAARQMFPNSAGNDAPEMNANPGMEPDMNGMGNPNDTGMNNAEAPEMRAMLEQAYQVMQNELSESQKAVAQRLLQSSQNVELFIASVFYFAAKASGADKKVLERILPPEVAQNLDKAVSVIDSGMKNGMPSKEEAGVQPEKNAPEMV